MSVTDPTERLSDRISDLEGQDTNNDGAIATNTSAISALQTSVATKLPSDATSLGAAGALNGADVIVVVQAGVAKKTTLAAIKTFTTS